MRAVVIREFVDKHTGELHPVGEELTVTKARYAEILQVGEFIRPAPAPKRKSKEGKTNGHGNSRSDD